jgi:hypothetical protein
VKQSTDDFAKFFEESIEDSVIFLIWADNSFSLFFFKKSFVDFFEIFLNSLNDTRINFLEDFLFLNDVSDVVNLIDWDVRDVWVRFSFANENLNCSYFFLRFSSHIAKSVVSLITILMTVLKNFWLKAQSIETKSFSLMYLKNLTMSRRSWWLVKDSLIIAEKFELLFTNCRRRWACRMIWLLRDECCEVRLIDRELFTWNKRSKKANLR